MTRRGYGPRDAEKLAGIRASYTRPCARCGEDILQGTQTVRIRSGWVHPKCASGWAE